MKFPLTFILLFSFSALFGQDLTDTVTVPIDTTYGYDEDYDYVTPQSLQSETEYKASTIKVKKFDSTEWKKIVGDENFDEVIAKPKDPPNRLQANPWAGVLLKFLAYGIILAVVIFILYYIIRNTSSGPVRAKEEKRAHDFIAYHDDIEDFDMDALISRAKASGNLNLVVRAYYLGLLKKLHLSGMIAWKKDKTNFDYLTELFARDFFYDKIRRLTIGYESVWYGERTISQDSFEILIQEFELIHKEVEKASQS